MTDKWTGHRQEDRIREFRFLEYGKPYSEIRIIKGNNINKAIDQFKKGEGKKITKAELKEEFGNE